MKALGELGSTLGALGRGATPRSQSSTTGDSGSSFSAEAEALFAQMSVAPDDTRKGHIDTLIGALKTAGVWAKCDRIYVLAAHDEQAARLDWKNPGTDTLTANNSPTFTTDRGFAGNGTSSYLVGATNLSAMTQFTQNSAHLAAWVLTVPVSSNIEVGTETGATTFLSAQGGGGDSRFRANSTATLSGGANSTAGFFMSSRPDATSHYGFKNGSQVGTGADNSAARAAAPIGIGKANGTFSTRQIAFVSIGASLNTEASDYYNAVLTYMQAVGAVA